MGSYLEDQLDTFEAIKNVSNTSSLSVSELFRVYVEMRQEGDMLCSEMTEETGNDEYETAETDDDKEKEPRKTEFRLAGIEMCVSGDDGCDLDDNGRIVDDLA